MNADNEKVFLLSIVSLDAIDAAKERQWNWDAQVRARDSQRAVAALQDLIDASRALAAKWDDARFPSCSEHEDLLHVLGRIL